MAGHILFLLVRLTSTGSVSTISILIGIYTFILLKSYSPNEDTKGPNREIFDRQRHNYFIRSAVVCHKPRLPDVVKHMYKHRYPMVSL